MRVFLAAVLASGQQQRVIHFSRELEGKPVVLYFLKEQISRLHLHFSYCQLKDEVIVWRNGFLGDFDQHTENMPRTITLKALYPPSLGRSGLLYVAVQILAVSRENHYVLASERHRNDPFMS